MSNLIFEINRIGAEEIEIEFNERFEVIVPEKGNQLVLKQLNEWSNEGDLFYKEIPEMNLPEILRFNISEKDIDAYTYDPHPLVRGRVLNVNEKNPMKVLNEAADKARADLDEMGKLFKKQLK